MIFEQEDGKTIDTDSFIKSDGAYTVDYFTVPTHYFNKDELDASTYVSEYFLYQNKQW